LLTNHCTGRLVVDIEISGRIGKSSGHSIDGIAALGEYGSGQSIEGGLIQQCQRLVELFIFINEDQRARYLENKEHDFSYNFNDIARFRVNVFMQRGRFAAAMRLIPTAIRTLDELGHPPILHNIAKMSQGFFLVVGPSQGKSTTLAAMIDEVNHQRPCHVITIEDPIEYLFRNDKAIVDQRGLGKTRKLQYAGRARQDPDVIMVGEMRDLTMSGGTAAKTISCFQHYTNNAAQTIDHH
jgi:twitching motility protein PilT